MLVSGSHIKCLRESDRTDYLQSILLSPKTTGQRISNKPTICGMGLVGLFSHHQQ